MSRRKKFRFLLVISILFAQPVFAVVVYSLTSEECAKQGGVVTSETSGCMHGRSIGKVTGMRCFCVCCAGEEKVDCKSERVVVTEACDDGNRLKFKIKYQGKHRPRSIKFYLGGENWSGYAEAKIDGKSQEYEARYDELHRNRSFRRIYNYSVEFADAPLSSCAYGTEDGLPLVSSCVKK